MIVWSLNEYIYTLVMIKVRNANKTYKVAHDNKTSYDYENHIPYGK